MCRLARAVCESVRARRRDGEGSLLTLGIRSLRCLHTHWRGRSMRQIFDHRETVMGLRRLARAVCQGVRARRRDGEGRLLTFGSRPSRCLHASWRGRSTRRTLEHREAVVGRCPRQRKVCESVGERRCDVSGSLVTFRFRLHRRLHTSWRGWWAPQIFRHRETVLGLCRWPRAVCESVECWRARWRDGAGCVRALGVSSHADACAHLGTGGGRNRFCHREMVLGLCRWPRTVCESVGERLRDGAGRLPTLCFQSHRCMLTSWRAVDVTDFATEKWCCNCRTVCESVGEGWHDGTGRLPAFGLLMCM